MSSTDSTSTRAHVLDGPVTPPAAGHRHAWLAACLLLVAAGGCGGTKSSAPAAPFVQGNAAVPQTPQATVTAPYTQAQAAGDLNVVVVGWNDSTAQISSISDTKGNAYALAVGPTVVNGFLSQAIYYAKNIAAADANANAVTVNFTSAANFPDVRILEYSGIDASSPLDVAVAAQGTGSLSDSGPLVTTHAHDVLIGANIVGVQNVSTGPGADFTQRLLPLPDGDIVEDRAVTATGSYNATAALHTPGVWIMQLVAFKASP